MHASKQPLYFEDLTVGQVFTSEPIEITRDAIRHFAAEFDPQPFHLDDDQAVSTLFGGLAASGWHTAALTMRLLVGNVPLAGGLIGAGLDELRWPKPVRPGDTLRIESEILELRPSKSRPDRAMAKMRTTTLNQLGEPVQIIVSNQVIQRRPAA